VNLVRAIPPASAATEIEVLLFGKEPNPALVKVTGALGTTLTARSTLPKGSTVCLNAARACNGGEAGPR